MANTKVAGGNGASTLPGESRRADKHRKANHQQVKHGGSRGGAKGKDQKARQATGRGKHPGRARQVEVRQGPQVAAGIQAGQRARL